MLLGSTVLVFPAAAGDTESSGRPDVDSVRVVPEETEGSDKPAPDPEGKNTTSELSVGSCPLPPEGQRGACLQEVTSPSPSATLEGDDYTTSDIVPIDQELCLASAENGGVTYGKRTRACQVKYLRYRTYVTVNGSRQYTGAAHLTVINYTYSSTTLSAWGHQIEISMYDGWGDATKASLSGVASSSGACTTDSSSFPVQSLEPKNSWVQGESYFETTATTQGDVGFCDTSWELTFINAPYDLESVTYAMDDIRCDNAVPNKAVGCVVPWFASATNYSFSKQPTLAWHVYTAQSSGLPGATFDAPLNRATDAAIIDENRTKACGDAPSIANKSCDEYPLASTQQGLSAGGERRSWDGCEFGQVPQQTGPTGVSVCMIDKVDNDAQGGIQRGFYNRERVLDGDPFRVLVVE